jgi:hypothetical protein
MGKGQANFDRRKTLEELESEAWDAPEYESHLVTTIHSLRHKPLTELTVEELRIMIGQSVGLRYLVPLALELLSSDPFVEGDYYRGDLLHSVLHVGASFWTERPDLRKKLEAIIALAERSASVLTAEEMKAFREGVDSFSGVGG